MKKQTYFKDFIFYASLNILGMISLSLYILADTFFVSKGLGANGLAALNLAIPIYSFIHGSGLMLGMGGATKYSIFKGRKESLESNMVFTNTVWLAGIFSMVFVFVGLFLSKALTGLLGADQEIFAMTNTYLKTILLFTPAFIMNNVLLCFIRNDGNPKLSMIGMLVGSFANIILDYIFIFPLKMGMFGAVFATGLAPIISLSILSLYFIKKKNNFHLSRKGLQFKTTIDTLALGFPSFIGEVSSGVVMIIFNIIILSLKGNIGVAAYGVIANLSLVVVGIFSGISQGVQPLISKTHGKSDRKNVRKLLKYAMATMTFLSVIMYSVLYYFAEAIAQIFNSENNIQLKEIAVMGLRLYFTAVLFLGFNIIISIYFTSTEKAMPAFIISLLRGLVIIIPMAYLLSAILGMTGVWLAFPITEGLVAVIGGLLYFSLQRKSN